MPAPAGVPETSGSLPRPLTRLQRHERTCRALRTAAQTQSPVRREALLDYVARLNLAVAHDVAGRHLCAGLDNDEILQVAYDALARAARDFEPEQHEDFLAFAVSEIQRKVVEHCAHTGAVPGASGSTPGT